MKRYKLIKDLVIPTGTILEELPEKPVTFYGQCWAVIEVQGGNTPTLVLNTNSDLLKEIDNEQY